MALSGAGKAIYARLNLDPVRASVDTATSAILATMKPNKPCKPERAQKKSPWFEHFRAGSDSMFLGDISPPGPPTGFSLDRCYAGSTLDCSNRISGEHWASHSLLKLMAPAGRIVVAGMRDVPFQVATANVVAKTLCTRHNSALSPIDVLFTRFMSVFLNRSLSGPKPPVQSFDGFDIERCLLKTMCGAVCGGVLLDASARTSTWRPSAVLLDVLFKGHFFGPESRRGLYVKANDSRSELSFAYAGNFDDVHGLSISLANFSFNLAVVPPAVELPPESKLAGAIYRPNEFTLSDPLGTVIKFEWT